LTAEVDEIFAKAKILSQLINFKDSPTFGDVLAKSKNTKAFLE
jgi:hypothetical protein